MKKDLSIIIAHYKPKNFDNINPLIKTLNIINSQTEGYDIEVIIADDGSDYSKQIINNHSSLKVINEDKRNFYIWDTDKLKSWVKKLGISSSLISKWVYIPKNIPPAMSKSRIVNFSTTFSLSNNLLFLDDDNYFTSNNSIKSLMVFFNSYNLIIGQVQDNNGRIRSYESNRVQGTTIAMTKDIFIDIQGFGEWTENFSCGVDSDLWIKLYNYFKINKSLKACYTDSISTYDSQSKRWKKYTKIFKEWNLRKEFNKIHNCKNYKSASSNLSRQKKLWIDNLIEK